MWLVVGLGNPGREYRGTRHNLGFEAAECLSRRWSVAMDRRGFSACYGKGELADPAGEPVVLLAPQTFMNLSGQATAEAMGFFKIGPDRLIVACDDLALPPGRVRARPGGSAGGHKGLADIIARLGREDFGRVRIGIGAPPPGWVGRDYVLARPTDAERELLDDAVVRAADAIETWLRRGVEAAMNLFNG